MGNSNNVEPEIEKVVKAPLTPEKKVETLVKEEVKVKLPDPVFQAPIGEVVRVSEMLGFKGDAVSDVFKAAVDRFTDIILRKISVKDLQREQIAFMETIQNSLTLDFPQYAIVTDYLAKFIAENPEAFDKRKIFNMMSSVSRKYNVSGRRRFTYYMTALITLAKAGPNRKRINTMVDITSLSSDFTPKAQQNIHTYFTRAYTR